MCMAARALARGTSGTITFGEKDPEATVESCIWETIFFNLA